MSDRRAPHPVLADLPGQPALAEWHQAQVDLADLVAMDRPVRAGLPGPEVLHKGQGLEVLAAREAQERAILENQEVLPGHAAPQAQEDREGLEAKDQAALMAPQGQGRNHPVPENLAARAIHPVQWDRPARRYHPDPGS